ncbi:alkyl/aryl-sulfatase [Rhizorhapis suberifaciens]|uniref:Alkyl sulfatase BDS1-like metallo-beta-lactamase superfamily hydrolase n=1 Tax=Rhizorhapis suberifaciens TaxID=13656 RepID=A0A840HZB0_9SPHN|nr:alkyl sulfatase dimerization domain-containing protein [Rhizorhapis suberifaciens]MBB4642848.1 alkyl sulfatase BDS1-like metallo-beta-lactamase superfamily hydrolase [Rhizorhapis suberifaciens]
MNISMRVSIAAMVIALGGSGANAETPTLLAQKPASAETREVLAKPIAPNPEDRRDFDFSKRGFMGTIPAVKDANGRVLRDLTAYDWVTKTKPDTVNPSLLRATELSARSGLFKVTDGVYQVRGLDAANMTVVETATGYLVIDPLMFAEHARAAMDLVYAKVGRRPVRAVVYTHSHGDHYGGVRGVVTEADVKGGKIAIIAPDGFMRELVSEAVIAGPAMGRRAQYHAGSPLEVGPKGLVGWGVALGRLEGASTFLAPTDSVTKTGETRRIDGLDIEFQMVPESEAPSEFNLYLPKQRALLIAETASCSLHNIQTLRGARPRDALRWAGYLDEDLRLYADRSDVVMMSHCWPRFGQAEVKEFLTKQRDTYKFIHDQTVRLMNMGKTPTEIGDELQLPESLAKEWYNRGYYGTVSHNAKGVYDRYLGWFDAVPANLNPLPTVEAAKRYVELAGGPEKMLAAGQAAATSGDYRWAAEVLQKLVFAQSSLEARAALADVYEQLGYQSESGLWRNFYLSATKDLREPKQPQTPAMARVTDTMLAMPTSAYLDVLPTRLDPAKIGDAPLALNLVVSDRGERALITLSNRVLLGEMGGNSDAANATIEAPWMTILQLFSGAPLPELEARSGLKIAGDKDAVERLRSALTTFADFDIVTP